MSGRTSSKWMDTMIKKHGSRENVSNLMRQKGAKGGAGSRGYAFGFGKVDPSAAGRIGGRASRRGKSKATTAA